MASAFERCGAEWIDADQMVHEVLRRPSVLRSIRRRFGNEVFTPEGMLDRGGLAARTFARASDLRALERLIHPAVEGMIRKRLSAVRRRRRAPIVVLDVPLLVESGWHRSCDVLIFVRTPAAIRDRRIRATRGWPPGERLRRESRQVSVKAKESMADFIIDNGADARATTCQVRRLVRALLSP